MSRSEFAESPEAVRRTGTVADEPLPVLTVPGVSRSVSDSVLRLYLGLLVRLPARTSSTATSIATSAA